MHVGEIGSRQGPDERLAAITEALRRLDEVVKEIKAGRAEDLGQLERLEQGLRDLENKLRSRDDIREGGVRVAKGAALVIGLVFAGVSAFFGGLSAYPALQRLGTVPESPPQTQTGQGSAATPHQALAPRASSAAASSAVSSGRPAHKQGVTPSCKKGVPPEVACLHRVSAGRPALLRIASDYQVNVDAIIERNAKLPGRFNARRRDLLLRKGETLVIPPAGTKPRQFWFCRRGATSAACAR